MKKKQLFKLVLDFFSVQMPFAQTELKYNNPYELLVSVILSAQCTDKRVNLITPALFEKFPTVMYLSLAEPQDVYPFIKSCTYPHNKSKHLVNMARTVVKRFKGQIPADVDELIKLPGVGRKTANVIASVIFGKPALAVDTHVFRVANRIGLTERAKTPLEAEKQLIKYIPENIIPLAHHWLILHGRYVCTARKPKCFECGLLHLCKYKSKNLMPIIVM
jgi:endonuclease III